MIRFLIMSRQSFRNIWKKNEKKACKRLTISFQLSSFVARARVAAELRALLDEMAAYRRHFAKVEKEMLF